MTLNVWLIKLKRWAFRIPTPTLEKEPIFLFLLNYAFSW